MIVFVSKQVPQPTRDRTTFRSSRQSFLLSSADTSLTMRLPPRVQKPHLPSMARAALHQAVAVALTSASLLGAPTNLPALAATPPAPAIEQPAKTWGVGNELKIPDPRQTGGRISDTARMLDAGSVEKIEQEIRTIQKDVPGSQVLVVTVDDVPPGKSPKRVATDLFNYWGIGSIQRENGVLVFVVKNAKRVEIEVGLALNRDFVRPWDSNPRA